jgi:hypothetical protein
MSYDIPNLEQAIEELAKAQKHLDITMVTLMVLADGDVMVTIMPKPGDKVATFGTIRHGETKLRLARPSIP